MPFLQLRDNLGAVADYHKAVGNTDVAIPALESARMGFEFLKSRGVV